MRLTVALERDLDVLLADVSSRGLPAHAVSAQRLRAALEKRRAPETASPAQLALWDGEKPWRGRLGPETPVRCDHCMATIPLKSCLQRQDAVWPGKKAPIHGYCGSGSCEQGREYKRRAAYSAAADWASRSKHGRPTYQFFRKDAGVQRQKRRIFNRDEYPVPSIDRPPGAGDGPEPLDREDDDVKQLVGDTLEKG